MAVQALYRKWRPQTFDEIVGQEHVVRTLRNALISGRIHHAYLFAGPRGTGKTTTARLLAKSVNCLAAEDQRPCNECAICRAINDKSLLDLIEIDAASNTGVDDVRELRERVGFRPNEARYKVYVIDEVHMLSNAAFNALLKTLEEPPPHAIFVLATTEPHKIPSTVISRCQRHDFRRIPVSKIVARLVWLTEQEQIPVEREALTIVAHQATGSMRDAESLLDQLISYGDSGITVADVRSALGIGASDTVIQMTSALSEGDMAQGLSAINTAVNEGADPRQFARQMVEHLRALLLLRLESGVVPSHVAEDLRSELKVQAETFSSRTLAQMVRLFNQAAAEAKGGWQPQLPLEMAFIEATLPFQESETVSSKRAVPAKPREVSNGRQKGSRSVGSEATEARLASSAPSRTSDSVRETTLVYSSSAPGDGSLTTSVLRNRWSELLDVLRPRNLSLEALMHSCEPVSVEGDVVILEFAHKFHRSKVEEDHNKQVVEDALSDLMEQQCRIRCILTQQESDDDLSQRSKSDAKVSSSANSIDDPVVRAAVEDLGAQVVQR